MNIKKLEQKDRYGNMFSIEFDNAVPEMSMIPDHPGMPIGTDTVPAWLTPGEFVVNAEATRMFGPQIEQMNNVGRAMQAEQGGTIPEYAAEGAYIDSIIQRTLKTEGLKANDVNDRGGKTNYGITQETLDAREEGLALPDNVKDVNDLTKDQAYAYYASLYNKRGLDRFPEDLRPQIFDMIVNHGYGNTAKILQTAGNVEVKGGIGDITLEAVNKLTNADLANTRMDFYNNILENDPSQKVFEKGWKARAKSFSKDIPNTSEVPTNKNTIAPIPKPEIPVQIKDIEPFPTTYWEGLQKLMGIGTKFKAEGGTIDDPQADILNAYKEFAQQQTKDNGIFIGSEELDEGGEYNKAAHFEEIDLMNQMQKERASNAMTIPPDEAIDTMSNIPELLTPPMASTDMSGRESYRPGKGVNPIALTKDISPAELNQFGNGPIPIMPAIPEFVSDPVISPAELNQFGTGEVPSMEVPYEEQIKGIFGGAYTPDAKMVEETAIEKEALKSKAQKEVEDTGQVSDETAAEVAKINAISENIKQAETAQANREEMQKNMAAKNAERMEERAYEEYLKQSKIANNAGVENFPSYEEWKVTQGLPEAPIKEEAPEKVAEQSEVLNKLADNIKSIDDETPVTLSEGDATGVVENSNDPEVKTKLEQAGAFLSGMFGDLFDRQELARMAVLYTGSMLLGNSHGGSLNYAAKNYLTRVDAKAANHTANVKKLMEDAEYTPASIQKYSETKDISVLTKKAAAVNPTGTKEMWYTPQGKRVQAEKFKVGDSYIWSADGGKTSIPAAWHQDAARTPGTDKYNDRIKSERGIITETIKELQESTGDVVPGDSKTGRRRTQRTGITPTVAANEAAVWAAKNGIDVAQMGVYTKQAYQMAVQDATDNKDVKPTSLLPYLNQLKLRQDTGITELFDLPTKKGPAKPMDAVKIEELSLQFIKRAGGEGDLNTGRNRDAVNQFWTAAAAIWNEKTAANPDLIKQYQRKAAPGETAFYAYAKEQLNLPM